MRVSSNDLLAEPEGTPGPAQGELATMRETEFVICDEPIERGFGRLKGRPLGLSPLYLQKEEHAVGLIRLLTLALRVLCLVEFAARRSLAAAGVSLAGLYAGQPRRATARPTSELLLRTFQGVNLVTLPGGSGAPRQVTPLSGLQQRILVLLELPADTYSRLCLDSVHPVPE